MVPKDKLFHSNDMNAIWKKFCGFLDLTVKETMEIQEELLLEEIELIANSPLGKKILGGKKPSTLAEFRNNVKVTSYKDYSSLIGNREEDALHDKPFYWAHTSGGGGSFKWAPYYQKNDEVMSKNITAALILSAANHKGDVNIRPGLNIFLNFPPRPYGAGWGAYTGMKRISAQVIPPFEQAEKMEFGDRIRVGLKMALSSGMDATCSMSSVLFKVGQSMSDETQKIQFSTYMLRPEVLFRLIRARIRAKRQKRPVLPKDLWNLKSIAAWGVDTSVYKEKIAYFWGREPYEVHVATEVGGVLAMQAWNKQSLILTPDSSFYEFIPEEEWLKNKEDPDYQPATVLLNELEVGKRYEIIISSFYGMPFLRYRLGDIFKVTTLRDEETGIDLPQFIFDSRADDMISIGGFPWLNEKIIWQILAETKIKFEDWLLRKEWEKDTPILHLYIELKEKLSSQTVEEIIRKQLEDTDKDFIDLREMLGIQPLKVTLLSTGTFTRFYEENRKAGHDLARLRPKKMNCTDQVINDVLRLSSLN